MTASDNPKKNQVSDQQKNSGGQTGNSDDVRNQTRTPGNLDTGSRETTGRDEMAKDARNSDMDEDDDVVGLDETNPQRESQKIVKNDMKV